MMNPISGERIKDTKNIEKGDLNPLCDARMATTNERTNQRKKIILFFEVSLD
mgnify:CR=1